MVFAQTTDSESRKKWSTRVNKIQQKQHVSVKHTQTSTQTCICCSYYIPCLMHTRTYTNHWQCSVNEWCGALKAIPYRAHNNEDLTELLYTGRLYNTIIWLLVNSIIGAFLILLHIFHICCIPLTKYRCNCYMPKLCMIFFGLCCFSFVYLFK